MTSIFGVTKCLIGFQCTLGRRHRHGQQHQVGPGHGQQRPRGASTSITPICRARSVVWGDLL